MSPEVKLTVSRGFKRWTVETKTTTRPGQREGYHNTTTETKRPKHNQTKTEGEVNRVKQNQVNHDPILILFQRD
jgi:hypothetical protein